MYKTYTIALLTLLTQICPPLQSAYADIRPAFARNSNMFMEFVFIDGYKSEVEALNKYLRYALTAGALGLLAQRVYSVPKVTTASGSTAKPTLNTIYPTFADAYQQLLPAATPENAAYAGIAGILGYVAYTSFEEYVDLQASLNVLIKFLREWNTNKAYTPEAYHPFFDELARIYTQKGGAPFIMYARDLVHGLQFIIKRTELSVSDVYKKAFETEAGTNYVVDTAKDVGTLLKTLRDIVKF